LALAAAGLDIAQWLRATPLWVDEQMIALNVRDRPFVDLARPLWLGQSAPLGWLVLQRVIVLAAGTSELVVRFIPLLFGILTLAAAAWIGHRWLHRWSAALLVALLAVGQWMSHYRFELKHYSADAFWALLLPAMAAWAAEEADPVRARRRWTRWWAVAALGQWVANGAVFVIPSCAMILALVLFRRHGLRAATTFALTGSLWLVSFAAHYALSLQYTHHSRYLRSYWASYVAPPGGLAGTLEWIGGRFEPLAAHPGGTEFVAVFWAAVAAGFVLSRRRLVPVMFASVPVMGFALGVAGLVPLHDRVAFWIAPALYVGIVLLADAGIDHLSTRRRDHRRRALASGAFALGLALIVSADILATGWRNLDIGLPLDRNRALDDRGAVQWLMDRRQRGDALITSRLGWPAIWWYGEIRLRHKAPGGRLLDGSVMYVVSHERPAAGCTALLQETLSRHPRVLLYVGFPDMQADFFDVAIAELSRMGPVVETAVFGDIGRVAVIDLRGAAQTAVPGALSTPGRDCLRLVPARRW